MTVPVQLAELLADVPDGPRVDAAALRTAGADVEILVVLDDDPTGTQSVADLPVLLEWTEPDLQWAFEQGAPACYVMTNSRSLAPEAAAAVNREVAQRALAVGARLGLRPRFVSRSDSTLRGHFPLETEVLAQVVGADTAHPPDGVLLVPAFPDAGRITVGGVHYAGDRSGYLPVGQTEYAADNTFGYRSSQLREWVLERYAAAAPQQDPPEVELLELPTLRTDPEATAAAVLGLRPGRVLVADSADENDLRLLAAAVLAAASAGVRPLIRCGPPLPRALIGQPRREPLSGNELRQLTTSGPDRAGGGLIVVGSHVGRTTEQLAALRRRHRDMPVVELPVTPAIPASRPNSAQPASSPGAADRAALDDGRSVDALADQLAAILTDSDAVLATSRVVVTGDDPQQSLAISREVSRRLVATVHAVLERITPRFVVAKGGITSSDVARHGLEVTRATVRGTLLPGLVSLWQPESGPATGVPYVVFAGNVGDVDALADVVDRLHG